jgi:hypothetical protein
MHLNGLTGGEALDRGKGCGAIKGALEGGESAQNHPIVQAVKN